MNDDLISRKALKKAMNDTLQQQNERLHTSSWRSLGINKVIMIIDNAPAVEPKRKFIRIITTYCPDDCICYEEYKGKPYFSIEYQENGETKVGFGTYNSDVLSRFLRDYFFN